MEKRELNHLLIKVGATHRRRSSLHFAKNELSPGQPRLLNYLYEHNGCIQREIAQACHMEPASVTSVINSMEKAGLIERRKAKEDKRAFEIWLTQKGFEKKTVVDEIFVEMADESFAGFTDKEMKQAAEYLNRIFTNLIKGEQQGD